MTVSGDHDIVISWIEVGKKEFAGRRIEHSFADDFTLLLRRDSNIGQRFIDKALDAVQDERNDFDHWLELVLAIAGLHN